MEQESETTSAHLNGKSVHGAVESAPSHRSKWMTEGNASLDLKYQPNPYRIDLGHINIVTDTEDRPVQMSQMGSAETWLSCPLIAHIAFEFHRVIEGGMAKEDSEKHK